MPTITDERLNRSFDDLAPKVAELMSGYPVLVVANVAASVLATAVKSMGGELSDCEECLAVAWEDTGIEGTTYLPS